MTTFEYTQTFVPLPYKTVTSGVFMFKSTDETTQPDVERYLSDPGTLAVLNRHGREGWELVSVQQLSRGHEQLGNQNAQGWALGYAITIGFLFIFKRVMSTQTNEVGVH
ncbi:DUF4177 domain-containing protein [Pseudomonas sp. SZ57]|uniref:DUF4177 domain-containing protein n=3 Tax=Pseudomonas TaxID=286 RepID=A0AB38BT30_PSESX|nr:MULTISPECIES: DUF4177 domain-containing protein [Pseudomonas]MCW6054606.1 DUF4177 domain-containing protein [Pseudomonas fragi]MEE4084805.1 DUF4177 domain-containing protein [Pseudomonas viridiflava]ELP98335.1 hypothetical protein A979_17494 [Pseudomonas syringae BRIP34876]ELQ02672.1 hypothetical protein A987_12213 [Pseudomonas syringae BRIP34881]EPF65576.1 Hypothetical protein PssSM_1459 [Pseudomonas syringae pv. syringae SM]